MGRQPIRTPLSNCSIPQITLVVAHPIRHEILQHLAAGSSCVAALASAMEFTVPTVSHHLRVLRDNGLVEYERRGKMHIYRLMTGLTTPQVDGRVRFLFLAAHGGEISIVCRMGPRSVQQCFWTDVKPS